jgi:hypothetical protein
MQGEIAAKLPPNVTSVLTGFLDSTKKAFGSDFALRRALRQRGRGKTETYLRR